MNHVLIHHGIKGQKWGVRRFQNEDDSRTAAGRKQQKQETTALKKEIHAVNKTGRRSVGTSLLLDTDYVTGRIIQGRTVSRAAKYVQKRNMSINDALEASRKRNRQELGAFIGTMAAVSAVQIGVAVAKAKAAGY